MVRVGLLNAQSVEQPGQFPAVQIDHVTRRLRPTEPFSLKTLLPETKSVTIPIQHLDLVLFPIAKAEEVTGERIELELFSHQDR